MACSVRFCSAESWSLRRMSFPFSVSIICVARKMTRSMRQQNVATPLPEHFGSLEKKLLILGYSRQRRL